MMIILTITAKDINKEVISYGFNFIISYKAETVNGISCFYIIYKNNNLNNIRRVNDDFYC